MSEFALENDQFPWVESDEEKSIDSNESLSPTATRSSASSDDGLIHQGDETNDIFIGSTVDLSPTATRSSADDDISNQGEEISGKWIGSTDGLFPTTSYSSDSDEDDLSAQEQKASVSLDSRRITFLEEELQKTREVVAVLVKSMKSVDHLKTENRFRNSRIDRLAAENSELRKEVKELKARMRTAEEDIVFFEKEIEKKRNNDDVGYCKRKITNLENQIKWKADDIWKEIRKMKMVKSTASESGERAKVEEKKVVKKENKQDSDEEEGAEPVRFCRSVLCKTILTDDLPLREDNVSVNCPGCCWQSITAPTTPGHKWVWLKCDHYQQVPYSTAHGSEILCQVCGEKGITEDTPRSVAFSRTFTRGLKKDTVNVEKKVVEAKENKGDQVREEVRGLVRVCRSILCNTVLTDELPLREDSVSVNCPRCGCTNITAPNNPGHKWVFMKCLHFQQVRYCIAHSTEMSCKVCGKLGTIKETPRNVARIAIRPSTEDCQK